ncbi:unnamed protein product [Adineta steineri]|uniref:glycerophosphodiester phosphodiesterase n=1 Tax=Adineta steineri TaxID=433720 RepID=A0A813ZV60_9BILA|nr:unnamed protein product [Adineta steineri]CAF3893520.1 unnamed protein product [Adineta steineri]
MFVFVLFFYYLEISQGLQRPLVIGHRGVAYLPELTLASQSMAHAYGADMIEIDVCLSRDDQLIIIHDTYLDGVTNVREMFSNRNRSDGRNYVIDFTLEELRILTVRERVNPSTNVQVYPLRFPSKSIVPFRLSTLNETIELLLGLNHATGRQRQLLIEIKQPEYHVLYNKSISKIVIETLNAYNLTRSTDPIIIQTFNIEELMHIRYNLHSQLRLFALMTVYQAGVSVSDYDFYRSEEGIRNLSNTVQALAPDHVLVVDYDMNGEIKGTSNLTKWAHQYDLNVYPYTFRKDQFPGSSFEKLVEYFWHIAQVDGFITDHPDVILELLQNNTTFNTTSSTTLSTTFNTTSSTTLSTTINTTLNRSSTNFLHLFLLITTFLFTSIQRSELYF